MMTTSYRFYPKFYNDKHLLISTSSLKRSDGQKGGNIYIKDNKRLLFWVGEDGLRIGKYIKPAVIEVDRI